MPSFPDRLADAVRRSGETGAPVKLPDLGPMLP